VTAAEGYAAAHGEAGRVRCTSGVGLPYRTRKPDFFCAVGSGVHCAELRVTKLSGRWRVRLYRRDMDCVLPA
jgi:hypothetical protein